MEVNDGLNLNEQCPKEIAMQITKINLDRFKHVNGYVCPNCNIGFYVVYCNLHKYCPNCGQKLQ